MKLSELLDKAAHDMDATQETRNTAWQAHDLLKECLRDFDLIDYEITHGDIGKAAHIARKAGSRLRGEGR